MATSSRPSFGGLWGEAATVYRANLSTLLISAGVVFLVPAIFNHLPLPPLIVFPVAYPIQNATMTLYAGIVALRLTAIDEGRDPQTGMSFQAVGPWAGKLCLAGFLVGVATVVGIFCFVFPGFLLMTMWFAVPPLIALDKLDIVRSLQSSWRLVRPRAGTVFLLCIATNLFFYGVWWLLVPAATNIGRLAGMVGSELGYVIGAPIVGVIIVCVYERLRRSLPPTRDDSKTAPI